MKKLKIKKFNKYGKGKTMKRLISILIVSMMLFSLIAVSGVSAADEVPWDKMIALYNMVGGLKDEISGANGTLANGASIVNDAARGSVLFLNNDGGINVTEDGQYAELAGHHIPDSDEMTISLWFKALEYLDGAPRVFETGDNRPINEGDTVPLRFICIHPHRTFGDIGAQATLNCNDLTDIVPNNRDRAFSPPEDTALLDVWVHVVWVINKGKPNTMYVNGVAYQSHHQGGPDDAPEEAVFSPKDVLNAPEGTRNAFLGRSGEEGTAAVNPCFNGYLSDLAIFSVALDAGQVAELGKADLSKGNPANVVAVAEVVVEAPAEEAPAPVAEDQPAVVAAPAPAPAPAPRSGDAVLPVFVFAAILSLAVITFKSKKAKN